MRTGEHLGELEQLLLLAILGLREDAYGLRIRQELQQRAGRSLTVGATYATLDRLEDKGYVSSWTTDPTPERGGRSKRCFKVNAAGQAALRSSLIAIASMWPGRKPATVTS